MAFLNETSRWETGIYQLETSDPVQGGPNGIDNRQGRELANRTLWLKNRIEEVAGSIPAATTSQAGVVQLSDGLADNANNKALTAKQGNILAERIAAVGKTVDDNAKAQTRVQKYSAYINTESGSSGNGALNPTTVPLQLNIYKYSNGRLIIKCVLENIITSQLDSILEVSGARNSNFDAREFVVPLERFNIPQAFRHTEIISSDVKLIPPSDRVNTNTLYSGEAAEYNGAWDEKRPGHNHMNPVVMIVRVNGIRSGNERCNLLAVFEAI